ncbi:MAG: TatD family hydrolase [Candidatus Aminicenantales bacterium]
MIDTHCHLESDDYQKDRDEVIEACRKELKAVVTSCAHPKDFDLTLQMVEKHKGFVFATVGIHPLYIKEIKEADIDAFLEKIKENKNKFVGIGEIGLDYWHVKEANWRKKQKELFNRLIEFAEELKKPVIVHSRDASEDTVRILEDAGVRAQWHFLTDRKVLPRVLEQDWMVSINTLILRSKDVRKIARDMPLERLLLETDAPWLGPEGKRNTPLAIRQVAEKIAQIKKLEFGQVWKTCGENAVRFLGLPVKV